MLDVTGVHSVQPKIPKSSPSINILVNGDLEYLPRCPTISLLDQSYKKSKLKQSLNADNRLSDEKKLTAETKKEYSEHKFGMAIGDKVEKTVFKVLQEFFSDKNHKDQNVVIINGIEMERINPARKQESREMDLIVICHIKGLIIIS